MSLSTHRSAGNDRWLSPRQPLDPVARRRTYGRVRPMDEDRPFAFLSRWFRRA